MMAATMRPTPWLVGGGTAGRLSITVARRRRRRRRQCVWRDAPLDTGHGGRAKAMPCVGDGRREDG